MYRRPVLQGRHEDEGEYKKKQHLNKSTIKQTALKRKAGT